MDLNTFLFLCENFACRGEEAIKSLFAFQAGRHDDCSTDDLSEMSDWLLVAALKLPLDDPLAAEINALADRIDEVLAQRGWKHPIIDDLPKWIKEA